MRYAMTLAVLVSVACGSIGENDDRASDAKKPETDVPIADDDVSPGRLTWKEKVQPLLAEKCASCHVGERFAFASLRRSGATFTKEDTEANYQRHLDMISLDAPERSRILAKMLGGDDPDGMPHAGGVVAKREDELFTIVRAWIDEEKAARCADCGRTATKPYIAYVDSESTSWALSDDPIRRDHGLRGRARIVLQAIDPSTLKAVGSPIDFLPSSFCGLDGRCDFRNLAVSYAGDKLAFECRLGEGNADWVNDVRWNVCVADIGADGRAQNARFLMPANRRHRGVTIARSDPFGLRENGAPLKGPYDLHFQVRRRRDATPTFSPDGERVVLSSQSPEPRSGADATQTYHGSEHLGHIVSLKLDGSDPKTIWMNEGGVADDPFFLRNGNVAFHTWNLERMDRHLYTQTTPDGVSDLPVLLGRVQGPNMWGRALQLANGGVLGMTGRRRSSIDNYVPFFADHTLGTGNDEALSPFSILDEKVFDEIIDFPTGYCTAPPDGPSCTVSRYFESPSWLPDGRALIGHNPEKTYVLRGEDMYLAYAKGDTEQARIASLAAFVPKRLGISAIDFHGKLERLIEPAAGRAIRYPVWIGKRWAPRKLAPKVDETKKTADLHIANVPLWFSFAIDPSAKKKNTPVASIVALRVLVKELDANACLNDGRPYRFAANDGAHDHPTHLGKNNATGFAKLAVPKAAGGDDFGDIPLEADGSVLVRLPAGKLLLFQGIDKDGHAVVQRSRMFALAPSAARVDVSVRADEYDAQCMSCHGVVDPKGAFTGLKEIAKIPFAALDYTTNATKKPPIDAAAAPMRRFTFLDRVRPLLDTRCTSCHSGSAPAGELSLEGTYSTTGNFPAGKWASSPGLADPAYMASVPSSRRVPAYNYSVTFAWDFHEDEDVYKQAPAYAGLIASHAPLGALAPWDPAYQNLFAHDGQRFIYLSGFLNPNFGRGDRLGGLAADSYLVEILTGRDLDKTRTFKGPDHTKMLSAADVRDVIGVIDVGFPFMATCDAKTITSGPNSGAAWGEPKL